MDSSGCSHGGLRAKIDSLDASAASERTTKDSTKLYTSNVEAVSADAAVGSRDNLEITEEMQCNSAQNLHECLPDLAEKELPSNKICETDTDDDLPELGNTGEIAEDLKIPVVHSGDVLHCDVEMPTADVKLGSSAAGADDVREPRTSSDTDLVEMKDSVSEKVLTRDSDDGIKLADNAAAAGNIEEMQWMSESTDDVTQQDTFGTDFKDLPVIRSDAQLPPLKETLSTMILFDVDDLNKHPEQIPGPWPCSRNKRKCIRIDRSKVQMPYATDNWQKVTEVLKQLNDPLQSWKEVEDAIKQYQDYPEALDFSGLEEYFCEKDSDDDDTVLSRTCLFDLIPKIAKLAIDLPNVCTCPIPLLQRQKNFTIFMSQYQIACLLANAFFCTYSPTANYNLVYLTFMGLFRKPHDGRSGSQHAKLDCIFNYFRRVMTNMPTGIITFQRQVLLNDGPRWEKSEMKLVKELRVSCRGRIERDAPNMLHVDFANKYVGGGMLSHGCVQEEILFMLCPELIVSRLMSEVLDDNETLVVCGHQRFNDYLGYASSFRWNGDYVDTTDCDMWGRHTTQLVAMDAQVLRNADIYDQLQDRCLRRELNKAYCGFRHHGSEQLCTVATGNWGCGAFGGDIAVKFLIQLMAASLAERPLFYFTFDDFYLARDIYQAHKAAVEAGWTVGKLWGYMQAMADYHQQSLSSDMLLQGIIHQQPVPKLSRLSCSSCVV